MNAVDFQSWIEQQKGRTLYAIVDPLSIHQPHVVFCQCDGQDGTPLLSPRELTNAPDGPWLLPVNQAFLQWWQQGEHAQSGILIATDLSHDECRAHFASLFQAALLGEVIFFPFYKPSFIAPMLPRLQPEEQIALLDGHALLLHDTTQWQSLSTDKAHVPREKNSPWWIIKEHHLDSTPNLPLLASNIESWLWQHQPSLMQSRINQGQSDFSPAFQGHFTALESIAKAQDKSISLQETTLTASVVTTCGADVLTSSLQDTITQLHHDELLFGLKTVFSQLEGQA